MRTVDQIAIGAPMDRVFQIASDVERWPEFLSHYRWVRFLDRHASGGAVEVAACRPFGALRYPVWWVSEMTVDGPAREIRYRHVRGITQRMDVVWRLVEGPAGVAVTVVHEWGGPAWPVIGPLAARLVIGPDRNSTRLNSSHVANSYAVYCLIKKRTIRRMTNRARGLGCRRLGLLRPAGHGTRT